MKPIDHGGALDVAIERWGGERSGWLDLSTGINPVATPFPTPKMYAWTRLPDAGAERALEAAARTAYDVPEELGIVAAPGTQAIIQHLPRMFEPLDVAVVGPTYAEHARSWEAAGHRVRMVECPADADVLIVVNPNNPDGIDRPADELVDRAGVLTVVDEAFRDASPDRSVVPLRGARTLALKSLGKFHGLAGVRLGHAIGPPSMTEALHDMLGPWAVSGPALQIGEHVLRSDRTAIAAGLGRRRAMLDRVLRDHGLRVVGGTPFFALVEHEEADKLFAGLARRFVLARRFDYRSDWLRFGLPATDAEFARLAGALADVPS